MERYKYLEICTGILPYILKNHIIHISEDIFLYTYLYGYFIFLPPIASGYLLYLIIQMGSQKTLFTARREGFFIYVLKTCAQK